MLISLNLKNVLVNDPLERPQPLLFNERTRHILPIEDNHMQDQLNDLQAFAASKLLRIKEKKSNILKFNFSRNFDFPPELVISGFNDQLEVISETKLLGVMITSDLKWAANTEYICKKAFKKM